MTEAQEMELRAELARAQRAAAWSEGQIHKIQGTLAQLASERDIAQAELAESRAQLVRTMNREAKLEAEVQQLNSSLRLWIKMCREGL